MGESTPQRQSSDEEVKAELVDFLRKGKRACQSWWPLFRIIKSRRISIDKWRMQEKRQEKGG